MAINIECVGGQGLDWSAGIMFKCQVKGCEEVYVDKKAFEKHIVERHQQKTLDQWDFTV
ncbi:MAG: hypothetical protein WAK17_06825 [Candidatus Nitrosopolaris sp.]